MTLLRTLGCCLLIAALAQTARAEKPRYVVCVHGGAGGTFDSEEKRNLTKEGIRAALAKGRDVLEAGGSSLDAVEAAVRVLEDNPRFNAGRGAIYNIQKGHMLDASIMDGRNRDTGGVANMTTVKNPITLARHVMEKTRHVLMGGPGAEQFARKCGVEIVDPSYFNTRHRMESLEKWMKTNTNDRTEKAKYETVGAVAMDQDGNLAAATSTGGRTGKMFGRIGDSPIPGAGNYADNKTCAVSGTGVGELYIRYMVAYDVAARMEYKGESLSDSAEFILTKKLPKNTGGIIAISADGTPVLKCNTEAMPRGVADSTGRFDVAIDKP